MYRFCGLVVSGGSEAMRFLGVYSDNDGLRKSDPERYISELLGEVGKCWRCSGRKTYTTRLQPGAAGQDVPSSRGGLFVKVLVGSDLP